MIHPTVSSKHSMDPKAQRRARAVTLSQMLVPICGIGVSLLFRCSSGCHASPAETDLPIFRLPFYNTRCIMYVQGSESYFWARVPIAYSGEDIVAIRLLGPLD